MVAGWWEGWWPDPAFMSVYGNKLHRLSALLHEADAEEPRSRILYDGFEMGQRRSGPLVSRLIEWLPDYALA